MNGLRPGEPGLDAEEATVTTDPWGRVDDEGTVYVKTTDGERVIGSWAAGSPEEALAFFRRKYEGLVLEVDLLERRIKETDLSPKDAAASIDRVRSAVSDAHAVGDLDGFLARLQGLTETVEVRITRHGPIITPLLPRDDASVRDADPPLALRWTALEPARVFDAVLALNRATDWDSFRAALADWTVPAHNFVYVDVEGHIGYALGGDIPVRAQGDGRLPVPGWTGEYEWTGVIPHAELPHAFDPPEGFIATANNRIAGDDYPGERPWAFVGGTVHKAVIDVSGTPFVDLAMEARAAYALD